MEPILPCRSNWCDFIRDFGDAFGGFMVGYGVCQSQSDGYIVAGVFLISTSIFIRFYPKIRVKKRHTSE